MNIYKELQQRQEAFFKLNSMENNFQGNINYSSQILEMLISMFDYEGLPETIDKTFLEKYLNITGSVGIGKVNGELICAIASPSGNVNAYGIGKELNFSTPVGSFNGTINEDCVLGWNNATHTPEFNILRFADMFAEIERSMATNVLYSRYMPVPIAKDDMQLAQLNSVLDSLEHGKPRAVLSKNILDEVMNGNSADGLVLNLTDVNNADKLQYLSGFFEDNQKRLFNIYGHNISGGEKRAQQSIEEISDNDSVSFIIPLAKLHAREKMCEDLNKVFGLNVSVKFSELWEREYSKYLEDSSEDESEDSSELESDDSSELESADSKEGEDDEKDSEN